MVKVLQSGRSHGFGFIGFAVAICMLIGGGLQGGKAGAAIDYNAEIRRLQAQNSQNEQQRTELRNTALTLEQKIAHLQSSIATMENQIRTNEAKAADLTAKIAESERKINEEKAILGQLIKLKYIDDDMSMMEMMAASDNLSQFVEKEQYNLSVQSKIRETTERIQAAKLEQEGQKALTEQLLADNRAMSANLSAEKQEVANLLAMNQQQQQQYSATIATTSVQITDLQRQQAEENLRFQREQARLAELARQKEAAARANGQAAATPAPAPAPAGVRAVNGAAYPYANAPFPNEIVDPWGMYRRQCVSYTAWAVVQSGRHMPYWGGRGNAKQWDDNARAAGIPVDGNPRVGDVAVRNAGTYGHVMYVDAVNGDGSITISQYNAAWTGQYSTARIFPGDLVFIHFP